MDQFDIKTKIHDDLREDYSMKPVEQIAEQVIAITGVTRSGTTLLGKMIATFDPIEYIYAPSDMSYLPLMASAGFMNGEMATYLMGKYANELMITSLLGRNANMRKSDESYALNTMSEDELHYRWNRLSEREDAIQYAKGRNAGFATKFTNYQPYYDFLIRSFRNCKLIHIVRNGLDVAASIEKKGWYADERMNTSIDTSMTKVIKDQNTGETFHVPFHIPAKDSKSFHQADLFERGLLSWCVLMEKNREQADSLSLNRENYFEFRYEDLLKNAQKIISDLLRFIGAKPTDYTGRMIELIRTEKLEEKKGYPVDRISLTTRTRAKKILKQYGYHEASALL